MALNKQLVDFPLAAGVDTRTDEGSAEPTKNTDIVNMRFENPGKLNPVEALTSAGLTPYGTPILGTEIDDKIYVQTTTMIESIEADTLTNEVGRAVALPGTGRRVLLGARKNAMADMASSVKVGSRIFVSWRTSTGSTSSQTIAWQWLDLSGNKLSGGSTTTAEKSSPHVTAGPDGSSAFIWYINSSSQLAAISVSTSNVVTTLTVPSVTSLEQLAIIYSTTDTAWWIIYQTATPLIAVSKYTLSGSTVSAAISPVTVLSSRVLALDIIRTTNYVTLGYISVSSTSHAVIYYNTSLTLQATKTLTSSASVAGYSGFGLANSTTADTVYALANFGAREATNASTTWQIYTYISSWSVPFSGSATAHINNTNKCNFVVLSKPFVIDNSLYAICADIAGNSYQTNALVCFLNTATAYPTTSGANDCAIVTTWSANEAASLERLGAGISTQDYGCMTTRVSVSGSKYFLPSIRINEYLGQNEFSWGGLDGYNINQLYYTAACVFIFDTAEYPLMESYNVGTSKLLSTNRLLGVDGIGVTPSYLWPNQFILGYLTASASGFTNGDIVQYIFEKVWVDSYGNTRRVESQPIEMRPVTNYLHVILEHHCGHQLFTAYADSTNTSVTNIYRTEANGSVFYYLTSLTAATTSYEDQNNSLTYSRPLASSSGELPISDLPSPRASCMWRSRLAALPADETRSIWYSDPIQDGVFPTFRTGLTITVPQATSELTNIISMDGVLYAFTKDQVFTIYGEPAGATGENSTLGAPEIRFNGVGCRDPKSLVLTPKGIIFHSGKGFYLILRNQELVYIGNGPFTDVSRTVVGHYVDTINGEVSFLFDSVWNDPESLSNFTTTWVYDYTQNEWYRTARTTTNGLSAEASHLFKITDNYMVVAGDTLYYPTTTDSTLGIYESPWIRLGAVQGYQRLYNILLKTQGASTCNMTIKLFLDYNETEVHTWTIDSADLTLTQGTIKLSAPKQKCESFKIRVYQQGYGGQSFLSLQGITAEIGVKDTLYKQSTGPNNA